MAPKKRATTEADKQKKRDRLLKAAWFLYEKGDGQLPTVTRIARQARVSKGTVYLYFRTKEEIFLQHLVSPRSHLPNHRVVTEKSTAKLLEEDEEDHRQKLASGKMWMEYWSNNRFEKKFFFFVFAFFFNDFHF